MATAVRSGMWHNRRPVDVRFPLALLFTVVVLAAGCGKANYVLAPERQVNPADWPTSRLTPHVLVVSIDGLRPDAISTFNAPTLRRLTSEGSYTFAASTITPSKTLPSHTSMLTGLGPEAHGVLWNTAATAKKDLIEKGTVFGLARAHGYRTAAFYSKSKFQPLQQPGTLDYSQAPGGWFGKWNSARTVGDVEQYLTNAAPNLLFVHLGDVDRAGHASGWMSPQYGQAVEVVDAALGRLLAAVDHAFGKNEYTVIVTADHGGHGNNHGSADPRDVLIPWVAWGRAVKPGHLASTGIRTMDTASTVAFLLGLEKPETWVGTPVQDAFSAVTPAVATTTPPPGQSDVPPVTPRAGL
jgi:arylsulfatase A-like enzyme